MHGGQLAGIGWWRSQPAARAPLPDRDRSLAHFVASAPGCCCVTSIMILVIALFGYRWYVACVCDPELLSTSITSTWYYHGTNTRTGTGSGAGAGTVVRPPPGEVLRPPSMPAPGNLAACIPNWQQSKDICIYANWFTGYQSDGWHPCHHCRCIIQSFL